MKLFIEHDAALLAKLAGHQQPHCDGLIVARHKLDEVLASVIRANPLGQQWLIDLDLPGERIVSWSGTLAENDFDANPMTWLKPGREAFAAFCKEIEPQLIRHGRTLCFQPHSRHVLSDVQSCFNFLREHESGEAKARSGRGAFEIALSPATMLEPSMLRRADVEDHLFRMFSTLGDLCALVFLSDVRLIGDGEDERCEPVPLGDGVLPLPTIRDLIGEHVPDATPIVLSPHKLDQQIALLQHS